jgi:hypothetical protein
MHDFFLSSETRINKRLLDKRTDSAQTNITQLSSSLKIINGITNQRKTGAIYNFLAIMTGKP